MSSSVGPGNWEFGDINWEDVKIGKKIGQVYIYKL